jgi:purine nucleosidase
MDKKMQKTLFIIILSFLSITSSAAQTAENKILPSEHKPIIRVIIDNDFGGDPDGLFQLAHQLLSPSNEVKGIIASQHYEAAFYDAPGTAAYGKLEADKLIKVLNLTSKITVVEGAAKSIEDLTTPQESEGANLIIREAMKDDPRPLYILCGAGLTTIASAVKKEPKISKRIKLVWIGGPEYDGMALPPPNSKGIEYNLGIDVLAAQIIFNESDIEVWQIPRNVYRQAIVSDAELANRLMDKGPLGNYLINTLTSLKKKANGTLGETYVLGDNPLVLVTALQTPWEKDSASSPYVLQETPLITDKGSYKPNTKGRMMRVYSHIDTRLMLEDLFSKINMFDAQKSKHTH